MYKNLADSVTNELKRRSTPQETPNSGEVDESLDKSTVNETQTPLEISS